MYSVENEGQLTLFPPGTHDHANLTAKPGTKEARKMTATSGRKLHESLKRSDRVGLLAKMLVTTSKWDSTMCYLTWKPLVTPRRRFLYRLVPSKPHIKETGYLWSPTPQASDCRKVISTLNSCLRTLKATPELGTEEGWLNPEYSEWLMGYPTGWSDLKHSEMPLSPNKFTRS